MNSLIQSLTEDIQLSYFNERCRHFYCHKNNQYLGKKLDTDILHVRKPANLAQPTAKIFFFPEVTIILSHIFCTFLHIISHCFPTEESHWTSQTSGFGRELLPGVQPCQERGCPGDEPCQVALGKGSQKVAEATFSLCKETAYMPQKTVTFKCNQKISMYGISESAAEPSKIKKYIYANNLHFLFSSWLCFKDGPIGKFLNYHKKHLPMQLGELKD